MVRAVHLALLLVASVPAGDLAAQSLRGSRRAMQRQHLVARAQDYSFLQTSAQVRKFANNGLLVRIPGNKNYALAGVSYPYARPAVKVFLERLGAQYRDACGERLVVTSLTRPVREQPRNASDLSVHPAGMAVDLRVSRKASCRKWLEKTLLGLESRRVVDATRERRPAHYHVAVFPDSYLAYVRRLEGNRPTIKLAAAPRRPAKPPVEVPAEPEAVEIEDPSETVLAANLSTSGPAAEAGSGSDETPRDDTPGDPTAGSDDGSAADHPEPLETESAEAAQARALAEYRVNRGDTLWTIARRHGTTVEQLKELNRLPSSRIAAGQVISVPAEGSAP